MVILFIVLELICEMIAGWANMTVKVAMILQLSVDSTGVFKTSGILLLMLVGFCWI